MEEKTENLMLISVGIILFLSVAGIVVEQLPGGITGYAVESASSSVTIQGYLSIAKSDNLTSGIDFGTITALPVYFANATENYNTSGLTNNASEYFISVSADSNVNVDFCIKANKAMSTAGDAEEIGLTNYTYANYNTSNTTAPYQYGVNLSTNYAKTNTLIQPGNSNYYRFWLNVSGSQAPGSYNNTVYFEGVQTGNSCS